MVCEIFVSRHALHYIDRDRAKWMNQTNEIKLGAVLIRGVSHSALFSVHNAYADYIGVHLPSLNRLTYS